MNIRTLFSLAIVVLALGSAACLPSGGRTGHAGPSGFAGQYAVALPEFASPVTREEIETAFARYGSTAIVRKLHTGEAADWNMIMNRVAAGDAAWIRCVAEYILPGANGAAEEDIIVSFAYGLQTNPAAVLASLGDGAGVSLDAVCSLPFEDQDRGFLENYGNRAMSALGKVRNAELVAPRNECINLMRGTLARAADGGYAAGRS